MDLQIVLIPPAVFWRLVSSLFSPYDQGWRAIDNCKRDLMSILELDVIVVTFKVDFMTVLGQLGR